MLNSWEQYNSLGFEFFGVIIVEFYTLSVIIGEI